MQSLAETRLRTALAKLGFDPQTIPTGAAILAATVDPLLAHDQQSAYHTVMDIVEARMRRMPKPKEKQKRPRKSSYRRPVVCVTTGEAFESLSDAAGCKGIKKSNLRNAIVRGYKANGLRFRWAA